MESLSSANNYASSNDLFGGMGSMSSKTIYFHNRLSNNRKTGGSISIDVNNLNGKGNNNNSVPRSLDSNIPNSNINSGANSNNGSMNNLFVVESAATNSQQTIVWTGNVFETLQEILEKVSRENDFDFGNVRLSIYVDGREVAVDLSKTLSEYPVDEFIIKSINNHNNPTVTVNQSASSSVNQVTAVQVAAATLNSSSPAHSNSSSSPSSVLIVPAGVNLGRRKSSVLESPNYKATQIRTTTEFNSLLPPLSSVYSQNELLITSPVESEAPQSNASSSANNNANTERRTLQDDGKDENNHGSGFASLTKSPSSIKLKKDQMQLSTSTPVLATLNNGDNNSNINSSKNNLSSSHDNRNGEKTSSSASNLLLRSANNLSVNHYDPSIRRSRSATELAANVASMLAPASSSSHMVSGNDKRSATNSNNRGLNYSNDSIIQNTNNTSEGSSAIDNHQLYNSSKKKDSANTLASSSSSTQLTKFVITTDASGSKKNQTEEEFDNFSIVEDMKLAANNIPQPLSSPSSKNRERDNFNSSTSSSNSTSSPSNPISSSTTPTSQHSTMNRKKLNSDAKIGSSSTLKKTQMRTRLSSEISNSSSSTNINYLGGNVSNNNSKEIQTFVTGSFNALNVNTANLSNNISNNNAANGKANNNATGTNNMASNVNGSSSDPALLSSTSNKTMVIPAGSFSDIETRVEDSTYPKILLRVSLPHHMTTTMVKVPENIIMEDLLRYLAVKRKFDFDQYTLMIPKNGTVMTSNSINNLLKSMNNLNSNNNSTIGNNGTFNERASIVSFASTVNSTSASIITNQGNNNNNNVSSQRGSSWFGSVNNLLNSTSSPTATKEHTSFNNSTFSNQPNPPNPLRLSNNSSIHNNSSAINNNAMTELLENNFVEVELDRTLLYYRESMEIKEVIVVPSEKSYSVVCVSENNQDVMLLQMIRGTLQVVAATESKLIEKLTDDQESDTSYLNFFLLTFRNFTTPERVLETLIERFNVIPPANPTPEDMEYYNLHREPTQFKVLDVMQWWTEYHWHDFSMSSELRREFLEFIEAAAMYGDQFKEKCNRIRDLFECQMTRQRSIAEMKQKSQDRKGKSVLSIFLDLDPVTLAHDMCLHNFKLFSNIHPIEFLNKIWNPTNTNSNASGHGRGNSTSESNGMSNDDSYLGSMDNLSGAPQDPSPNLSYFITRFDYESYWTATEICFEKDLKKRTKILKNFILLCKENRNCNNFFSVFAILGGLNLGPVQRLKKTWEGLSSRVKGIYDEMEKICDPSRNMKNLRETISQARPPMIPFLAIYLKDLTFMNDGNPSKIEGMINFAKLRMMGQRVMDVVDLCKYEYSAIFVENASVQNYLRKPLVEFNLQKLKEASLLCEPN